jgi:hypothetical protein
MRNLFAWVVTHVRAFLGLDWLAEAREIAEAARRQREEDEARANRDPHDFARWLQDPKAYRRPRPEDMR